MKKKGIVIAVLVVMSLAFTAPTFASEVGVEVDQDIVSNVTVLNGGSGDGHDKYKSGAYMGAFEGMYPGMPNIPVTKGGLWSAKSADRVFASLPAVITADMFTHYVKNKTKLVDKKSEKKKLAKEFSAAQSLLLKTANVVVVYDLPRTTAVRPWAKFPGDYAKKGVDYLAAGSITFQTREGFEKWYRSLKLENISSDDLGMMVSYAAMKLGADFIVPTGEGAEILFGAESGGVNIGGLLAGALGLYSSNALPVGGSIGTALASTSGSNGLKANPFLSVALIKVLNADNVRISLGVQQKSQAAAPVAQPAKKGPAPVKELSLKKDHYLTLAMCAKPVPAPNGVTRLQVAQLELDKYIASERTDLEALSVFQSHLAQAIRDNIKGENLKMAQMGVALAWLERADVIKRAKEKGIITEAEFAQAYIDNLKEAEKVMKRYRLKSITSLGTYAENLKQLNDKTSQKK